MLERKTVSQCLSADYCIGWNDAVDAMPKWISVEERLPEKGEWVIAHDKSGEMFIGEIHVVDRGRKSVYCESGYDAFFDITHWMPLPEAPKER